jgi:hypothetical protein
LRVEKTADWLAIAAASSGYHLTFRRRQRSAFRHYDENCNFPKWGIDLRAS